MGKVQLFEIRLSESRVVYSPGEPLAGTVTVRLSGSLQYRGEPAACPPPPALGVPPARLPRAAGPGWAGPGLGRGGSGEACGALGVRGPLGRGAGAGVGGSRGGAGSPLGAGSGCSGLAPRFCREAAGERSGGADRSNLLDYFLLSLFAPIPQKIHTPQEKKKKQTNKKQPQTTTPPKKKKTNQPIKQNETKPAQTCFTGRSWWVPRVVVPPAQEPGPRVQPFPEPCSLPGLPAWPWWRPLNTGPLCSWV